ncbi:hypothetical protein [Legionella anisa]|uniref:hypothetical protein n=1 Tax=Legionella anisa TaxID=28082 RepID=UPI002243EE81|nr:hypothetical protein [Legionella anisa]MCW8448138.1 hypothetical protein [Legionella anisa]
MFELLEKPRRYKKDKNKDLFKKFNEKLKEYNTLVSQDAPENLRITALQEIDFFLEDLKLKISDSNLKVSITPCLRKILEWNELSKALGHLNISSPSKLPMEKQLFDRTTNVGSLMTKKEWLEALKDSQKVELRLFPNYGGTHI